MESCARWTFIHSTSRPVQPPSQPDAVNVDVNVAGYRGATVSRLYDELHSNIVADADVIFVHGNDYEHHEPIVTAQRIMSLAIDMVCSHNARCVIVSERVRFAVHRTDWCIRVKQPTAVISYPKRTINAKQAYLCTLCTILIIISVKN